MGGQGLDIGPRGGLGEVGGLGVGLRWRGWEGGLVGRAGRGI